MSNDPNKTERVSIYIDGSNFYHSIKDTLSINHDHIDFSKLIHILRNNRLLINTFYYNASLDRSYNEDIYWKQQKFFSELRNIPAFRIILCNMRKIRKPNGKFEYAVKGDDIHLATDMLSCAYENLYDTAILINGDGDFRPVIRKIQKLGKHVENGYFSISRSSLLKQICNKSILLDNIVKDCIKK